ncbi:MAG: chorismate synthase [Lentisphaerae bacterium]|nr:chorismate synthase [Lentisphaerota bacterium]
MSGNTFGSIFKITTFGESHGPALGVTLDGVPAGIELTAEDIQKELDRRKPGQSILTTQRQEADAVEILSGVFENTTTGTPLALLIRNTDQRSRDYGNLAEIFRPGHADYSFFAKYGIRDYRGGGRSSGRETAARVAAGAVAKKLLAKENIMIRACTSAIGGIKAEQFDWDFVEKNPVRTADPEKAEAMAAAIDQARMSLDSIGGMIECRIANVPAGWGEPVFDKLDALLAHAMLSLGAIKGIEFGDGFAAAQVRGSQNNDSPTPEGWGSNHAGGILGGISNGAEIVFKLAVKPTPSIAQEQTTVDKHNQVVKCAIHGRHDPCLCPRMVPVVEAMAAIVLADMMLRNKSSKY